MLGILRKMQLQHLALPENANNEQFIPHFPIKKRQLLRSIRIIPFNGEIYVDNGLSDWEGEVEAEQKDDSETEKYETKWSVKRDEIQVILDQPQDQR